MKTNRWPWWALIAQTLGGLLFIAIALAVDDAYRTAELRSIVVISDPVPAEPFNWLSLLYMSPYLIIYVAVVIVIPALLITAAFIGVGLPIRVIPAVRSWWVKHYVPLILLGVSGILLVLAWLVLPAAYIEVSTYQPSSPIFAVGTAIGAFAIWHLWLPGWRATAPTPPTLAREGNGDEEWGLGRLL